MRGIPRHKRQKYAEEYRKMDEHDLSFKEYSAVRARQEGAISKQEAINILEHESRTDDARQEVAGIVQSAGGAVIEKVGSSPIRITDKATGSYAAIHPSGAMDIYEAPQQSRYPSSFQSSGSRLAGFKGTIEGKGEERPASVYGIADVPTRSTWKERLFHPVKSIRKDAEYLSSQSSKWEYERMKYEGKDTLKAVKYGGLAFLGGGIAATTSIAYHPIQTVKGLAYSATHPFKTIGAMGEQFKVEPAKALGELAVPAAVSGGIGKMVPKIFKASEVGSIKASSKTAEAGEMSRFSIGDKTVDVGSFGVAVDVTSRKPISIGKKTFTLFGKKRSVPIPEFFKQKTTKYRGAGKELVVTEPLPVKGQAGRYTFSMGMGDLVMEKIGMKQTVKGATAYKSISRPFETDSMLGTGAKWQTSFEIGDTIKGKGGAARAITTREPFLSVTEGAVDYGTHPIMGEVKLGWVETMKKGKVTTKTLKQPKTLDIYASAAKKKAVIDLDHPSISMKEIWGYQTQRAGGQKFLSAFEKEWQALKEPPKQPKYPKPDMTLPKTEDMIKQQGNINQRIKSLSDIKPKTAKSTPIEGGDLTSSLKLEQKSRPPSVQLGKYLSTQLGEDIAVAMEAESIRKGLSFDAGFALLPSQKKGLEVSRGQFGSVAPPSVLQIPETKVSPESRSFMPPKVTTIPVSRQGDRLLDKHMIIPKAKTSSGKVPKTISLPKTGMIVKPETKTLDALVPKTAQTPKVAQQFKIPPMRPLITGITPVVPFTPPPPPPVAGFTGYRFFGGGKGRKRKVGAKSGYMFSVEASLFDIVGKKPSKQVYTSGLTLRPILAKKKKKKSGKDFLGLGL